MRDIKYMAAKIDDWFSLVDPLKPTSSQSMLTLEDCRYKQHLVVGNQKGVYVVVVCSLNLKQMTRILINFTFNTQNK